METLRERDETLIRSVPDREVPVGKLRRQHPVNLETPLALSPVTTVEPAMTGPCLSVECVNAPEKATDRFSVRFVDPLFPVQAVPHAPVKRFCDIVIALFVLTLVSPIMILAALAVKLTSQGPVIFRQVRVGRGGRYFWCYKFRSMCIDAEAKKKQLMHLNEASGPVFKMKRDPRITPVGGFIRKFSIDELPQFFNVLKGEMSLVGPRPPVPSEVAQYTGHQRGRLAVQPGLTCLWQVGGRSNVSFEHWVELDLLYIDTMSFSNDVKILLKTIPAVLRGSGAH